MILVNKLVCFSLITYVLAVPQYLVSLKLTETLDHFFQYDLNYPVAQRVKSFVSDSYTIGNFTVMTGNFTKSAVERLKRCPLIADITPDIIINAFDIESQDHCPRHLARVSQVEKLTGHDFTYFYDSDKVGSGVNAYIIDSGIEIDHPEFQGRAHKGIDFTKEGFGDINGHGSHVAGLIGSKTYGVAKDVNLFEVKALDKRGAGSLSTIISAIEFTVNHRRESGKPGVANLSLGAAKNKVLNQAVDAAADTGLVIVVAAGNSNVDACLTSPASSQSAITVGAIDDTSDGLTSFSNWGKCVDIFASGAYVSSVNSHDYYNPQVLSGTSMSAPIVTGMVSTLLSSGVSPLEVKNEIIKMSIKNKIPKSSMFLRRKTPNRIVYNGLDHDDADDPDSGSDTDYD